jgi:hypothetical protein
MESASHDAVSGHAKRAKRTAVFRLTGHWVAYISDESGRDETVRAKFFRSVEGNGGFRPMAQRRLVGVETAENCVFVGPDRSVMVVAVQPSSDALHFDRPRTLFRLGASTFDVAGRTLLSRSSVPYDVFLMEIVFIALAAASSSETNGHVANR